MNTVLMPAWLRGIGKPVGALLHGGLADLIEEKTADNHLQLEPMGFALLCVDR